MTAADLRQRVFDWIESIVPALNASAWKSALFLDGLSVVDAAMSPLNLRVLHAVRSGGEADPLALPQRLLDKACRFVRQPHVPDAVQHRSRIVAASVRSRRPDRARVVFAPAEPTHVLQQQPVAAALASLGVASRFVTSNPSVMRTLRNRNVEAVFSRRLGPSVRAARRRGGEAMKAMKALARAPAPMLPPFEGRDMTAVVARALAEAVPRVHESAAMFAEIRRQFAPSILVPGNVVTLEGRVLARLARTHGLLADSIMHGAVGGGEPQDSLYIGDRLFVFGESGKRELIRLGNDARMLEVCGAPYLDAKPAQTGVLHPALCARLGLDANAPVVLLATSGPGHCTSAGHLERLIEAVARASATMRDVTFVAKLHRKDSRVRYDAIRAGVPGARLEVFEHGDPSLAMFEWLQGCRAMLTTTSFAAHEALVMDVPVITMDFADEFAGVDFIDAGATLHVRTDRALLDALDAIVRRPRELHDLHARASRFVDDAFHRADGQASLRCARSIAAQLPEINAVL